jgi:hypothetical protein
MERTSKIKLADIRSPYSEPYAFTGITSLKKPDNDEVAMPYRKYEVKENKYSRNHDGM